MSNLSLSQGRAVSAYKVLLRLSDQPLPLPLSFGLFRMKRALLPAWEFQLEQEQKILKDCEGRANADGTLSFFGEEKESKEKSLRFMEKLRELAEMENELEIEPVSVSLSDAQPLSLSVNDLNALDGLLIIQ